MQRLLAAEVTSASALPSTCGRGILTDGGGGGVFCCEPPSRFFDFEVLGTTPTLVVAAAWKLSSLRYKASLLSHLLQVPGVAKGVPVLLDQLASSWVGQLCRHSAWE